MIRLRRWWSRHVRRWHGELCHDCGRSYFATIWHADDDLWFSVVGRYAGLLCPSCFSRRADQAGLFLVWRPTVEVFA